jgi:hypothetical protein
LGGSSKLNETGISVKSGGDAERVRARGITSALG